MADPSRRRLSSESPQRSPKFEVRFISIRRAAAYLSLSEQGIRRLIRQGKLSARRFGRSVRLDIRQLDGEPGQPVGEARGRKGGGRA